MTDMNKEWLFKQHNQIQFQSSPAPNTFNLGIKHRAVFNGSLNLK